MPRKEVNTALASKNAPVIENMQKAPTKNIAGPPVYYPPGKELFQKSEASAAWRAGVCIISISSYLCLHTEIKPCIILFSLFVIDRQGGYGKGSGKYEYEAESKSKSASKSGAAVVPVCLPLCCAMPCTIM